MRQTDVTLVVGDRGKARVAALISEDPERLPGPNKPVSRKVGTVLEEVSMGQELKYVGIDVAKE